MTDEYAIDAATFARTLLDQRETQMKGGIYHLTQIQLAYNSNRIEGSQLSEEQTRYLYETQTVTGEALVDDVIETSNHFRAFDAMLDHAGSPIEASTMRRYHALLKEATADSRKDWFVVGGWKSLANAVGNSPTTPPALVESAIADLVQSTPKRMSFEDIVDWHVRFERIHPFQDGNGRVGRLLMFEQCLANDVLPFVVLDDRKALYYRGLAEYDTEPGFLRETLRFFQDAYYDRFKDFVPRA